MALTHYALPAFPDLLAAWEEGFDSPLRASASATTGHGHSAAPTPSVFEDRFEQFTDRLMTAHIGTALLTRDISRVVTVSAGVVTVLRVLAGICAHDKGRRHVALPPPCIFKLVYYSFECHFYA